MPPPIHPELLQRDGYMNLDYWGGPYPQHAGTSSWQDKAIYFVAQCDINVGAPKKYPFKPIILVLTRKSIVIFKAADLTLCRKIKFETVGAVYSNARDAQKGSGFQGGAPSSVAPVESATGFMILKEAPSSKGGRSNANLKSSGDDAENWGGDIALQGPKTMIRDLLGKLMVLVAFAKKLTLTDVDGTSFGGAMLTVADGGGVTVDLCRGNETSLLDTTVAYTPPPKTTDPRAAFIRMDQVMIDRRTVAERFLSDHPDWKSSAELAEIQAKLVEEEKKRGTPWCATARRIADLKRQPLDFLQQPVMDAKLEQMYAPLRCTTALWCGRLALTKKHSPSSPDAPADGGTGSSPPSSPTSGHIVVCAFMTRTCLYLSCNGFDILRCIPVEGIRTALVEEKVSRKRTASMSPMRKESVAPFSPAPSAPGAALVSADAVRVRVVLFYYALVPLSNARDDNGAAVRCAWEAERLTLEFETQAFAMTFFEALKSVAPDSWRVNQLNAEFPDAQIETESALLADSMTPNDGAEQGDATSRSQQKLLPPPALPTSSSILASPYLVAQWCPTWRRSTNVQWIAFRVRLFAFYETYCPHKLGLVDKVVWEWKDSEGGCEDVMATLSRKYGREPDAPLQSIVQMLVEDTGGAPPRSLTAPTFAPVVQRQPLAVPGPATSSNSSRAISPQSPVGGEPLPPASMYASTTAPPALLLAQSKSFRGGASLANESFQGIPRVTSVPSMRNGGGSDAPVPQLTSRALETMNAPQVNRSEVVARSLGQTFQHKPTPEEAAHRILSAASIATAASAASPGAGSTIGDVLRSFAFSVTFFDRFAAMYFPANSGIHSGCDEQDKVLMFQRLIRAYAPNEDSFYATLIQRAEQRRAAEQEGDQGGTTATNVGATPTRREPYMSRPDTRHRAATTMGGSSPTGSPYDPVYDPVEPRQAATPTANSNFHVDPVSAWGGQRSPARGGNAFAFDNERAGQQPPPSALTMLRRYQAQTQGGAGAAPFRHHAQPNHHGYNARGEFVIAADDIKAAMIEPLSSSLQVGSEVGGVSLAMLPPMFSAKRPDGFFSTAQTGKPRYHANQGSSVSFVRI